MGNGQCKFVLEKKCEVCGATFRAKTIYSVYCSPSCKSRADRIKRKERKAEEKRRTRVAEISAERIYISVTEAVDLFGIPRNRIYRMIRKKLLPVIRNGGHSIRIPLATMDSLFPRLEASPNARTWVQGGTEKPVYRFDATDSYTVNEISEKFGVSPSTAATIIRRFSIPKCQKGRFVYVPKAEIDKVFKPEK